jgi:hypothetical protein
MSYSSLRTLAVQRTLLLAVSICSIGGAAASEVSENWGGPHPVPLSVTPFFNNGALRPQTMIYGSESFSYYDTGNHKVQGGGDNISHYADGVQPTQRTGIYACSSVCGATAPGAGAGYVTGVDIGALHAAADSWHLDDDRADTSTGGSAFASAAVGDMVHLDQAATVHFQGYVEGDVMASGEHSQANASFSVMVFDPASVRLEGDGMLVDMYGGYSYTLRDTGSGPGTVIGPPTGPLPKHYYDLTVNLPAGDSFVSIMLSSSTMAWQSGAQSYFGDTATFSLLAPADAHASVVSGLIPLATAPVPEPGRAALAACGLLVLMGSRRRK